MTHLIKGFLFAFLMSLQFVSRASAVNDQNNWLLKQTPVEQTEFLARVVGHGCTGEDAFYQGIVADNAYWSVRCSDGGNTKCKSLQTSPRARDI
jgi:hypothetical protein